jgi:hypothetical protein
MNDKKNAGGEHEITYRQEILSRLFSFVRSTDSFHLIGAASMGKTRLLDFLMRNDVQEYYLGDDSQKTWLIRVDLNRMPVAEERQFTFFELLLSSIILCCIGREDLNGEIMKELVSADSEIIKSRDPLLALRFFEWEVSKLCQKYGMKLCLLFDEFDDSYRKMPPEVFAQLRSVRDANKNQLLYGMFLRVHPKKLRDGNDTESFYELFSRNVIGIGPYSKTDAMNVIQYLERDWETKLTPEQREKVQVASGGHPGLIKALLSLIKDSATSKKMENNDRLTQFSGQETIQEECEKIWYGLEQDERLTLLTPFNGDEITSSAGHLLVIKGILQESSTGLKLFSPLFEQYLRSGLAKV